MRKMKKTGVIVFAAVLLCSALILPEVYAAKGVDTTKKCSLSIDITDTGYSELKTNEISIDLYKVADINVSGNYTPVTEFAAIDLSDIGAEKEAAAAKWVEKAAKAKEIVDVAAESAPIAKTTQTAASGQGKFSDLPVGLYLVDAQIVTTECYQYQFQPYLISLPDNAYARTDDSSDEWIYEVSVGLKPEKLDRYGDLIIKKTLDVYNATNPNATFVFQVEAAKTDVDTSISKVVYSNVVSLEFTEAGTQEMRIEKIPAGAVVTVTEVYSGASYKLTSEKEQTATILASSVYDILPMDPDSAEETAAVEFSNTHSDVPHGGSGVVNNFTWKDNSWSWTPIGEQAEDTPTID